MRGGTGNFCAGNALTPDKADRCIQIGRVEISAFVNKVGANIVVLSEVRIGNTTTLSTLLPTLCRAEGVESLCGTVASMTHNRIDKEDVIGKKVSIVKEAM